jgi:hypothetical protein
MAVREVELTRGDASLAWHAETVREVELTRGDALLAWHAETGAGGVDSGSRVGGDSEIQ